MSGVCIIFSQVLRVFSRTELSRQFSSIARSITLAGLAAGRKWWRCCSVIWAERSRYARSAEGWRLERAS
jgi:hypothetical protein